MDTTIIPGLDFIKKFGPGLTTMLVDKLNPRYCDGDSVRELSLTKPLFDAQAVRVEALGRQLTEERTALLVGEMGVGKTLMGTAVGRWLYLESHKNRQTHLNVLITCPPTLISTWQDEIKAALPAGSFRFINFLKRVAPSKGMNICILPYSRLRMHFHSEPYAVTSFLTEERARRKDYLLGRDPKERGVRCPRCGNPFLKKSNRRVEGGKDWEMDPMTMEDLQKMAENTGRAVRCEAPRYAGTYRRNGIGEDVARTYWRSTPTRQEKPRLCGEILTRPIPDHSYSGVVSEGYVAKKKFRNQIDLVIADEIHSLKNDGVQGMAGRWVMNAAKKVLGLTGTLTGGYARDLFYLLWALSYKELKEDGYYYSMLHQFCDAFGSKEIRTVVKGKKESFHARPMTGISAAIYEKYLVGKSVFFNLDDLDRELVPYSEHRVSLEMTAAMKEAYSEVDALFRQWMGAAVRAGFHNTAPLVSKFLHASLSWPDRLREDKVDIKLVKYDTDGKTVIGEFPIAIALSELLVERTPKDDWLIDKVREVKARGEKVLCYFTYSNERDCGARIQAVLEKAGLRTALLRSSSVAADKRKAWIEERVDTIDILLCHPDLVKEGLNLNPFTTVVWLQPDYNLYRYRQASRRSRRVNQTKPVDVYCVYYEECSQETAWALVASKLDSALIAEGNPIDSELLEISYSPDSVFREMVKAMMTGTDKRLTLKSRVTSTIEEIITEEDYAKQAHLPSCSVTDVQQKEDGTVCITYQIRRGRRRVTVTEERDISDVPSGAQLAMFG